LAGALTCDPGHSRGQKRGGSTKLFAVVSFGRSRPGAPLRPAPFQRRGCGPLLDLLGPRGAFTEPRRPSDVPIVARRHARPTSSSTDALSVTRSSRMAPPISTHEPEDLTYDATREGTPGEIRERLPSYREPTSRNPQTEFAANGLVFALPSRTGSPSFCSCFSSEELRASSRLASCTSTKPCDSPADTTRDAYDRLLPPERLTNTRARAFPVHAAAFAAWMPHGVFGSVRRTGGPGVFTTPENASADLRRARVGVFFPRSLEAIRL